MSYIYTVGCGMRQVDTGESWLGHDCLVPLDSSGARLSVTALQAQTIL